LKNKKYSLKSNRLAFQKCALIALTALHGAASFAQTAGGSAVEGFETPAIPTSQYFSGFPAGATAVWTDLKFSGTSGKGIVHSGDKAWGAPTAPESQQMAFLQGADAHISKYVQLPAGTFNISFYAAQRAYGSDVPNAIQVKVNGTSVGQPIVPVGTAFAKYTTGAFPLSASGYYNVELVQTQWGGDTFVDAVAVNQVPTQGKVYYVDANAPNDTGNGSVNLPKKYISSGAKLLSVAGGDTLIIKAGTYGNSLDAIGNTGSGANGHWNIIKAETDGAVTITVPLDMGLIDHYVQFEGLKWDSKTTKSVLGRFVKILRCGFKDGPATGNTENLAIGTNDATPGAQYVLVEDSYMYGSGSRYKMLVYNSDKVVLRRIVVRHQGGWTDVLDPSDPEAGVSLYNSTNVLTQNVMVVDSGGTANFAAAIYHPSNNTPSANIRNVGAIVLNTKGVGVAWDDSATVTGMSLENSAIVGSTESSVVVNGGKKQVALKNLSIVNTGGSGTARYGHGTTVADFTIANSIVTGWTDDEFKNGITEKTLTTTAAPKWLTQPVGANGATILKRLGKPGTLYGEPGYDQEQTDNLWPWPNEVGIKESMCMDVSITTGFCAKSSLTQYVWGYLGNAVPMTFGP
jgi:hypothetical protein